MKEKLLVEKTISLYKNVGWKAYFSKVRVWDAPYLQVEKMIPKKGNIVELGCGEGIFSNMLALGSTERRVTGIDLDKRRISEAYRGLKNTKFIFKNAVKYSIPKSDVIVLFHLLHHLKSFSDQEKILRNSVNALDKNGRLIIVEIDIKFSVKYFISWFTDHFVVPILFEKKLYEPNIYFRKKNDWVSLLKNIGLSTKVYSMEENKPFSHIVFECKKS